MNSWQLTIESLKRNELPPSVCVRQVLCDMDAAEQTINPWRTPKDRFMRLSHLPGEEFVAARSLAVALGNLQQRLGCEVLQCEARTPFRLMSVVQPSLESWRLVPTALWLAVPYRFAECLSLGIGAKLAYAHRLHSEAIKSMGNGR